ncbi:hypothetical protein MRX96_033092, partial [Rhipicephalus microplus]
MLARASNLLAAGPLPFAPPRSVASQLALEKLPSPGLFVGISCGHPVAKLQECQVPGVAVVVNILALAGFLEVVIDGSARHSFRHQVACVCEQWCLRLLYDQFRAH